jgi:hypothetical protein
LLISITRDAIRGLTFDFGAGGLLVWDENARASISIQHHMLDCVVDETEDLVPEAVKIIEMLDQMKD